MSSVHIPGYISESHLLQCIVLINPFLVVVKNFENLIMNRGKDAGIVVMSLQEYNSLMATNHELFSRKNELRLDAAISKLKKGESSHKKLLED